MKQYVKEFFKRGMIAAWGGPVILAVIYGIHALLGEADTLTMAQVCREILTITLLAFIAGGVTAIYRIERLPLFPALLIHGAVLYFDYLIIYLINGWLVKRLTPLAVFTVCFAAGYGLIWVMIYSITRRNTKKLNLALKK